MTLILHHLNDSRSQRIVWLLEELEIPYELKCYKRLSNQRSPPELAKLTPTGLAPVLEDGDLKLAESGAIVDYVLQNYAQGKADPPLSGRTDDLYYAYYSEGTFMPVVFLKLLGTIAPAQSPFFVRPLVSLVFAGLNAAHIDGEVKKHANLIEDHLATKNWFCGGDKPTKADYMMVFPLQNLAQLKFAGPKTIEYLKRIQERPAWKKGIEKGGPYIYEV
ncbi:thioredoxin-like protein [Flagelloscypha sp. PMI_526]|nr:thioredoxin-like protein [Flagelloscypha sp. PMI_526]